MLMRSAYQVKKLAELYEKWEDDDRVQLIILKVSVVNPALVILEIETRP